MSEITETMDNPTGNEATPEPPGGPAADLADREEALEQANRRTAELERTVTGLAERSATLEQSLADTGQKLAETERALAAAVNSYTAQVIAANPHIPAELITGETIEGVDSSLKTAQTLIEKVKERLEAEIKTARIPAGAPLRTPADFSTLSPREKIQHGIGGR